MLKCDTGILPVRELLELLRTAGTGKMPVSRACTKTVFDSNLRGVGILQPGKPIVSIH